METVSKPGGSEETRYNREEQGDGQSKRRNEADGKTDCEPEGRADFLRTERVGDGGLLRFKRE